MNTKYRIVRDNYAGFEVQFTYWWLPFWIECNWKNYTCNTFPTLEEAQQVVKLKESSIVWTEPKPTVERETL